MAEIFMSPYPPTEHAPDGYFPYTFLNFTNTLAATWVAWLVVRLRHGVCFARNGTTAFWNFLPIPVTDLVDDKISYELLRHISFAQQSIVRLSNILPVMLLGRLINRIKYTGKKYLEAGLITLGVVLLSVSQGALEHRHSGIHSDLLGIVLLPLALAPFALNVTWQDRIYRRTGRENVDVFQMMLGVNVWTIFIITFQFLLNSGSFWGGWEILQNQSDNTLVKHLLILAKVSVVGQFVRFCLIRDFGPLVYSIVWTVQRVVRYLFHGGHTVSFSGTAFAIVLVVLVLAYQIVQEYRACQNRNVTAVEEGVDPPILWIFLLPILLRVSILLLLILL
jgi:hypothetical protein